jgi:hypothetical protein
VPYEPLINAVGSYPPMPPNAPPSSTRTISLLPRLDSAEVPGTAASQRAQPPRDGWPYPPAAGPQIQDPWRAGMARQPMGVSSAPSVNRAAGSNFVQANVVDADMRPPEQQTSLPQYPPTQPITPLGTGPGGKPPLLRFAEQPHTEVPELERWHDEDLAPFVEAYRRAAADMAQDLGEAITSFGKRFYEDSILRAGSDLRRLVERFADEPIKTTLSVLNGFPQTKVEGEFLAAFAAVFNILANAKRGLDFERAVLDRLKVAKNKTKISVEGLGRSVPDALDLLVHGVTEIKSGLEIDNSVQLMVQAAYARIKGVPFNLVVSCDE